MLFLSILVLIAPIGAVVSMASNEKVYPVIPIVFVSLFIFSMLGFYAS